MSFMQDNNEQYQKNILRALDSALVVRAPKKTLSTFGPTELKYFMITTPSYLDIDLKHKEEESVVREGVVYSEKPDLVTPYYMLNLDGFSSEAMSYLNYLRDYYGANSPGLLYKYQKKETNLEIVSDPVEVVASRIGDDLDKRGISSAVVLTGPNELWDVCLFKYMHDYTVKSSIENARDLNRFGLLENDPLINIPKGIVQKIENLFLQIHQGLNPDVLHAELMRWGIFEYYEDRFYRIFNK